MIGTNLLPLLIFPAGIILYLVLRAKQRRAQQKIQQAAEKAQAEGNVRCFTCGVYVPLKGALEKKGRYFCGIKKQDRP